MQEPILHRYGKDHSSSSQKFRKRVDDNVPMSDQWGRPVLLSAICLNTRWWRLEGVSLTAMKPLSPS